MANWKTFINSGFSGCMLLAYARDHVRQRDVKIWLVPGERDDVGISDGTDAWIAPVSADCFSVNVKRLIDDLNAGKQIPKPVPPVAGGRRRLLPEAIVMTTEHLPGEGHAKPSGGRRRLFDASAAATPSTTTKARRARLDI